MSRKYSDDPEVEDLWQLVQQLGGMMLTISELNAEMIKDKFPAHAKRMRAEIHNIRALMLGESPMPLHQSNDESTPH